MLSRAMRLLAAKALLIFAIGFPVANYAQTTADKNNDHQQNQAPSPYAHWVVWTQADGCALDGDWAARNAYLEAMRYACRETWDDGLRFRSIAGPGFNGPKPLVMIEMREGSKNLEAIVGLSNQSEKPIEIDPANVWADVEPISKRLDPIPPEKIAASIMRHTRWSNALTAFGSAFAKQTTTATTSSGDTISITSPDVELRERVANQNNADLNSARNNSASIISTALKRHTLMPHSQIMRYVYFPQVKHFEGILVHLPIDNVDYIFMFSPVEKAHKK
jgi:hypothetical protein